MSVLILVLILLVIFILFVFPAAKLGIMRKRKLKTADKAIQPAIKASNQRFRQSLRSTPETTVAVLIENHKEQGLTALVAEHGLSLHLEHGGKTFLFDTGQTGAAVQNAKKMNIELSRVEAAVISHGHRDHGGGLRAFFEVNHKAPVYLGKNALTERYSPLFWFRKIPIGLDAGVIQANRERIRFVESKTQVAEGLSIIARLQGSHPAPRDRGTLLKRHNGRLVIDDFMDEIALVIENSDGLIVLSGCGHNGVLNLLSSVETEFPGSPIKALLGGFHLMNPRLLEMSESQNQMEELGQKLLHSGVESFMTCHCTGVESFMVLKSILKDRLEYISTGSKFGL